MDPIQRKLKEMEQDNPSKNYIDEPMSMKDRIYFGIRTALSTLPFPLRLIEEKFHKEKVESYQTFNSGDVWNLFRDIAQIRDTEIDMMTKDYPLDELKDINPIILAQFGKSFVKINEKYTHPHLFTE
jgi:hypothetical protein